MDGEYVINPTAEQEARSDMHVTVASTADLVAMIEAGANEIDNDTMFGGIMAGHAANQEIVAFINEIRAEIGKPKVDFPSNDPDPEMYEAVKDFAIEDIRAALDTDYKRIPGTNGSAGLRGGARKIRRRVSRAGRQARGMPL